MTDELDNPAWAALTTHQSHLARGGTLAKRYPGDVTPIAAIGSRDAAALLQLAALVPEGDSVSLPATLPDVARLVPVHLTISADRKLIQMVSRRVVDTPMPNVDVTVLSDPDAADMMALAELTHPGPFRLRTYTLGLYIGIRVDGRLVAMAGERMHFPGYHEISAVCTHPDFQGRGYSRALVVRLVEAIRDEGNTPFLHLEETNERARALYRGLGFVERARLPLLVVERAPQG